MLLDDIAALVILGVIFIAAIALSLAARVHLKAVVAIDRDFLSSQKKWNVIYLIAFIVVVLLGGWFTPDPPAWNPNVPSAIRVFEKAVLWAGGAFILVATPALIYAWSKNKTNTRCFKMGYNRTSR